MGRGLPAVLVGAAFFRRVLDFPLGLDLDCGGLDLDCGLQGGSCGSEGPAGNWIIREKLWDTRELLINYRSSLINVQIFFSMKDKKLKISINSSLSLSFMFISSWSIIKCVGPSESVQMDINTNMNTNILCTSMHILYSSSRQYVKMSSHCCYLSMNTKNIISLF